MSKSNHEVEAMRIIAEAQKKEKGSSGFMALFGGGPNYEEASEMYCNAANLMLMAKQYNTGGELYEKAAECSIKANQGYDAASTYVKAANAYKKSNPDRGIQCLKRAVEYYATQGRFSMAAKIQKEIAEALEKNKDTMPEAIEAYQAAADYFEGEGSTSQANQCYLKIAEFCASVGNYTKAVELFEKAAYEALENKLLQYGAKDLFLKAGLCQLCVDVVLARRSLENYLSRDHRFSAQREADFLEKLIQAVEKLDVQAFSNACVEWDSISRLDNWKQDILLFIKRSIESQGDEVDEDDLV